MKSSNSSFDEASVLRFGSLTLTSSTTESISPVTLNSDWSRVAKLLLLTALSVTGSVGNVFMISSVMIEDNLKKRGNSFLVNIALADILITGLVIPASTVVILADLTDAKFVVCNFQWFLALVSCLVSVLTISATAVENYARLCMPPDCYNNLTPCKITTIIIFIWIISCTAVTIQTVLDLGPDYCKRTSQGLLPYQISIGVVFVFIPAIVTFSFFSLITYRVKTFKSIPTFRPPVTFTSDYELMKSNMYGFIFFVMFWLPFGLTLALGSIQTISQRIFYSLAWLALSKSCFLNFLYCLTNRHFRNAYVNLFHYCCCKTTVSFSRRSREHVRPTGDVRVHIIPGYDMYSYTSPQRSRDVAAKTSVKRVGGTTSCGPASTRPNGRDIYEL
ncbi:G-protein coupled octopamine receptor, putative [Pediculus humanus corporis]|uniref:G-protein coupled octopamine receptor, putative n=1 Tax=Pediculus humanus subsp. corporis TaxID=121224 RepID=E0VXG7_PEDHC|nr:G-protein coupled octopamine receptor, putative [Pediculus humanus corporis]EEB18073.1 G-protein coupled octopamine receptor, putative [Pediculus humanus corporis]